MAMPSKRHIVLLSALLQCAAAQAQPVFEPAEHDFGAIAESDGRVSHVFTGVNRGEHPAVILDVVTSCGCTVPEFSRKPVLPGDTTRIAVTFDPMNRPGAFAKELAVYSSERKKIATLTIRGEVVPREKSIEELYPVNAGGGLRLDGTLCAFTYIYQGGRKQMAIGYVNASESTLRLELRPEQASGLLTATYPRQIGPGERGTIDFAYAIPAEHPRYGTLRDALTVYVDGRSCETVLVTHGIGVDDPAATDKTAAPQAQTEPSIVKFGPVKHSAPIQRRTFVLANTGCGDLVVRAVENGGRVAVTLKPGCTIAPEQRRTVELLLDPSAQDYGILTDHLLIVTDDPVRPMRRVRVTAIIEE